MSTRSLTGPIHAIPVDNDNRLDDLREENRKLRRELEDLKNEHNALKSKFNRSTRAAANFKNWLNPIRQFIKVADGEFDDMDLPDAVSHGGQMHATGPANPYTDTSKWEGIASRLESTQGDFIRALLRGGAMSQPQMAAAMGVSPSTVFRTYRTLNSKKLVSSSGGKYELRND